MGASELQAVRTELHDLRQELRDLIAALPGRSALAEQAGTERNEAQEGEESMNALDGGRGQFDAANGAVKTA